MAFTAQSNYRAAQRPQYQNQQFSALESSYAAEYEYAPGQQDFNGRPGPGPGPGPSQQYPDSYEASGGGSRHDRSQWEDPNREGNSRKGYGDASRRNDGRMPKAQRPIEAYPRNHPRTQGQPRSKSRPPERNRHQNMDQSYLNDGFSEPQDYQQRHQPDQGFPNRLALRSNNGFDHAGSSYNHQNNAGTEQQYGTPVQRDNEYHGSQPSMEGWSMDYPQGPVKNPSQDYQAVTSNPYQRNLQDPQRSTHGHPPGVSSKSESSLRSKTSSKRIIETQVSPDTVAWDNPFPTFPMRPKKGAHLDTRSLDGSMAEGAPKGDHHHNTSPDGRPATASSKSSSYTILQPQSPPKHREDYFDRNASDRTDSSTGRAAIQEWPNTSYSTSTESRIQQLKPPAINGRHSEDSRARPFIPVDSAPGFIHERSRTMPAAMSEAVTKPSGHPKPAIQTSWQEPGLVAGYYGPDDRGYTPTSPSGTKNYSHHRPYGQLRGNSDEKRPFGHAAVQNAVWKGRQLHNPQDSFGDVLDNYYDGSAHQEYPSHRKIDHSQRRFVDDEEMPNFDAVVDTGPSHRRKLSVEQNFSSHQGSRDHPQMPLQSRNDGRNNLSNDTYTKEAIPRSRSQPNFKDRPSPRQQHANGFDFGVPGSSPRPPATAPAQSDYGFNGDVSTGFPNHHPRPGDNEHFLGERRVPGITKAAEYGHDDWSKPPWGSRPPAAKYEASGPPDRFRPPMQSGRANGPFPVAYQGHADPDRFRPPPPRGGHPRQGPSRPPGARQSPADARMNNALPPVAPQHERRSPPGQDGQMRPLIGRPLPATSRTGPTPPPSKPPINPDALPAHPAPVRTGLTEGSPVNKAGKPAPVRQYNATPSPMQLSNTSQKPGSSGSAESKRESLPVTHQELDRLKQITARNPDDMATQLVLAKKLVEAAVVLVDERADARSRSKAREKYTFDAHKIVKKLSGNGYTEATFYLADCYTRGSLGLESDTREAFKLYQTAAKAGYAQAAYRVAVCCEIGQEEGGGTSRDAVKAIQWYKRAATLGDTPAMYKMGIISLKGLLGQPKNPREALVWLKRAAERADQENPHALHELALLHEKPSGNDGVNRDEAYSMRLFTQAANLGYKFSQYRLGSAHEYGLMGCLVDPRQSIAWYSKAAVQEEHQSELALSGWYLTGSEGILQQSDTEAYLWARKAAQAGLAKAEYAMGYFTEVGIGAPANLEDAKRWYWRAASQNFPKARDRLEDLRKGGPTKRKERVSRSNIRKSTEGECTVM